MSRGWTRESGEGLARLPRDRARLPAHFPPLPEDDQRRNSADAEAMRGRGVAVGVELHDQHFALTLAREVVEHGSHDLAGAAPVGVSVHDNGCFGALEDGIECRVRDRDGPIEEDREPPAATRRADGDARAPPPTDPA